VVVDDDELLLVLEGVVDDDELVLVLDGVVDVEEGGGVVVVVVVVGGGLWWRQDVPVAVGRESLPVWALAMPAAMPMVGTVSAAMTPRTRTRPRDEELLIRKEPHDLPAGSELTGSSGAQSKPRFTMQDVLSKSAATCYVKRWIRGKGTSA
jgi:hypothetical protein